MKPPDYFRWLAIISWKLLNILNQSLLKYKLVYKLVYKAIKRVLQYGTMSIHLYLAISFLNIRLAVHNILELICLLKSAMGSLSVDTDFLEASADMRNDQNKPYTIARILHAHDGICVIFMACFYWHSGLQPCLIAFIYSSKMIWWFFRYQLFVTNLQTSAGSTNEGCAVNMPTDDGR